MRATVAAALFLLVLLTLWLLSPLPIRGLESRPDRVASYAEALGRVDELRAQDTRAIGPECGTILLTHAKPTQRVIVLLHGLTNCPAQFDSIGRIAFHRGANV